MNPTWHALCALGFVTLGLIINAFLSPCSAGRNSKTNSMLDVLKSSFPLEPGAAPGFKPDMNKRTRHSIGEKANSKKGAVAEMSLSVSSGETSVNTHHASEKANETLANKTGRNNILQSATSAESRRRVTTAKAQSQSAVAQQVYKHESMLEESKQTEEAAHKDKSSEVADANCNKPGAAKLRSIDSEAQELDDSNSTELGTGVQDDLQNQGNALLDSVQNLLHRSGLMAQNMVLPIIIIVACALMFIVGIFYAVSKPAGPPRTG